MEEDNVIIIMYCVKNKTTSVSKSKMVTQELIKA